MNLRDAYYYMALNRAVEERLLVFYKHNKVVGGLYRSLGQEAISVGTAMAMEPQDVVAPLIRNVGAYLVRGFRPRDLFTQYMAKADSPSGGRDCNTHFGDPERGVIAPISMLGAMIPVMVGYGWAAQQKGENRVTMTYIGDGGTSTGDFHEGLNLASVLKAPFVVVAENNGYAYSTPTANQMGITDLADRAKAYGIPAEIVDGNDVEAVYAAAQRAFAHARSTGPYFLECKTFRMRGHAEHDDAKYVPKELVNQWKDKDPLDRLKAKVGDTTDLDAKIAQLIEEDAAFAEASPFPDPSFAFGRVFQ